MIKALWGVFALASILAGPVRVFGQAEGTGAAITGRVVDFHNHPVSTLVELLAMGDIPANTVYTDSDGHFIFMDLPAGNYNVEIDAEGFQPFRQAISIQSPVTGMYKVNAILDPLKPQPKAAGPAVAGSPGTYRVDISKLGHPFSPKALSAFADGNTQRDTGDLKGALKKYKQALKEEPGFYPALNNEGAIYLRQGNTASAEKAFQQVLKLNPEDGEAYINLGHLAYKEGEYSNAVDWLEKGLERFPQSATGNFFLGSAYYRLGQYAKAEPLLKDAYNLDSSRMSSALLQLANVSLKRQDSHNAANYLRLYLKANPRDPQAPAIKKTLANLGGD
jgi:Tfp pilus assembly protein PilF